MNSITKFNKNCQDTTHDPKRVRVYADILLTAVRGKQAGAVRLWTLAKHFDQPLGYGLIDNKTFREWIINKLHWKPGTYDRYINQAIKLQIIFRCKGDKLRLAAPKYAAIAVGCGHIWDAVQLIKLKELAGKNWLPFTYGAYMRRFNGHSIATKTISVLTGLPIRTIYHYDRILKRDITKRRNYAIMDYGGSLDDLTVKGIAEIKGWHVFSGFGDLKGRLIKSIPGQRFIKAKIAARPKHEIIDTKGKTKQVYIAHGQRKKINGALNAISSDSFTSRGIKQNSIKRLYIEQSNAKARKKTLRELRALDREYPEAAPIYRYLFLDKVRSMGIYEPI